MESSQPKVLHFRFYSPSANMKKDIEGNPNMDSTLSLLISKINRLIGGSTSNAIQA